MEKQRKIQEEIKAKEKREKHEKVKAMIHSLSQERQREPDERTREHLNKTPLFRRLEEHFNLPLIPFDKESYMKMSIAHDLEAEKEALAKIKESHKPIRLSEIEKFARYHHKIYTKKVKELK